MGCQAGSVMPISSTMLTGGYDLSWHLVLGELWTRDALCMMFVVALYLPWCRYLASQEEVEPQLYADNPKCVSRDPLRLLRAAKFTAGYVRLVGQEVAPSKCLLLRKDMRDWVLSQEGDQWTVKFDVRDLGGLLDTLPWLPEFGWSFLCWFLSLLSLLIFMVGLGLSGPSLSLMLSMVLRLLFWLVSRVAWSRRHRWLVLVRSSA